MASCQSTAQIEKSISDIDYDSFVPVSKTSYEVQIRKSSLPMQVYNQLEDVYYDVIPEEGRVIITGTAGEEWLAKESKVLSTYTKLDGTPLTAEDIPFDEAVRVKTKAGSENYALFIPVEYIVKVPTSWGEVLTCNNPAVPHGKGDYILCSVKDGNPDFSDMWVVNGEIFLDTYEIL